MTAEKDSKKKTDDGTTVVETVGRDFRVEGNDVSGYVGVDSEYRTYANESDRPYITDEDVDLLEKSGQPTDVELLTVQYGQKPDEKSSEKSDDEDDEKKDEESKAPAAKASTSTPAKPADKPAEKPSAAKTADK